jgi:hypothetical protein
MTSLNTVCTRRLNSPLSLRKALRPITPRSLARAPSFGHHPTHSTDGRGFSRVWGGSFARAGGSYCARLGAREFGFVRDAQRAYSGGNGAVSKTVAYVVSEPSEFNYAGKWLSHRCSDEPQVILRTDRDRNDRPIMTAKRRGRHSNLSRRAVDFLQGHMARHKFNAPSVVYPDMLSGSSARGCIGQKRGGRIYVRPLFAIGFPLETCRRGPQKTASVFSCDPSLRQQAGRDISNRFESVCLHCEKTLAYGDNYGPSRSQ